MIPGHLKSKDHRIRGDLRENQGQGPQRTYKILCQYGFAVLIAEIYAEMDCIFYHFVSVLGLTCNLVSYCLKLRAKKTKKNKITSCSEEQDNNDLHTCGQGQDGDRILMTNVCLGQDMALSSVGSTNMQLVELICV